MQRSVIAVGLVALLVSTTLGVSAFTTGQVTRESNVQVVGDSSGLIGLSDGTSGGLVKTHNKELTIDFNTTNGNGVNVDARFELGNTSNPKKQHAFTITNNDAENHSITINYNPVSGSDDTGDTIKFKVYAPTDGDTSKHTITDEGSKKTFDNVGAGETLYVVVVVDTDDDATLDDLSGKLEISAAN